VSVLALGLVLVAGAHPGAAVGTVQVARGVTEPSVYLIRQSDGESLRLVGEPTRELKNLQSATVEVLGNETAGRMFVEGYRIIEVQGGGRPVAVGTVVLGADGGLGLGTDAGAPVPLSAGPKLRAALGALAGGKVWIIGEKLLSGEIKVVRYGILREPKPRPSAEPAGQNGAPATSPKP
jgi:hypothetical protein